MVDQWISAMEAVSAMEAAPAMEAVSGNAAWGLNLQCVFFLAIYIPFYVGPELNSIIYQ